MKSQRIPEHQLNVTTTVGQAIENLTNEETARDLNKTKTKQVNQSQGK